MTQRQGRQEKKLEKKLYDYNSLQEYNRMLLERERKGKREESETREALRNFLKIHDGR
jgi:hypothetical protein